MAETMRMTAEQVVGVSLLTARERARSREALNTMDVMAMATINGARAAGLETIVGSLEVGKRADIVVRRCDLPETVGGDPMQALILSAGSKSVDTVVVDGAVVVEGGRSIRVDHDRVLALARRSAKAVQARMAG